MRTAGTAAQKQKPVERKTMRGCKARTLNRQMLRKMREKVDPSLLALAEELRPSKREECCDGIRPCPFVTCKYHLYLDVNPNTGSVKLNFPDKEVWEISETCALDVADRAGITLEEVGVILNLTRERIRQVEMRGLAKLREVETAHDLKRLTDED